MSSAPDAGRVGRYTIDDAVEELKDLVDLTKAHLILSKTIANTLRAGGGAGGPGPGGPGGAGLSGLFDKYFGRQPNKAPDMGHGLGGWIKGKLRGGRVGRWTKRGHTFGRGLARTLGMKGKGAVGLARGFAGVAGAAGAASVVATAFIAVAVAVNKAYQAVDHFTEAAMATAKHLSQVSGGMAAVVAQREIGEIMRDMKRGQATAGRAQDLMRSESRRKDQENRLEIVFDNAKNGVLTLLNDMIAGVLKPIADATEAIADVLGMSSSKVEASGVAGMEGDVGGAMHRHDADAARLMEIARKHAAAAPGGGFAGAAPPGMLP